MKYQLLTILLFFCIQQNVYSVNKQEVRSENDSTFLLLIEPYCRTVFPLYCTDLDYWDNTDELDPTNYELQMKYLLNISAISKLSESLVYDNKGKLAGSYYYINKLQAFKKSETSNFIILFYIRAAWDLSRSLVYAVFDSFGNEVYSQVLVTEDPVIEDNPQKVYKQTLYKVDDSHIEILVFESTDFYGDLQAKQTYINYLINEDGSLTLQQTDHNIKD